MESKKEARYIQIYQHLKEGIFPYRSFPSGITASASKKYEYVRWAERPNHYIIEDDFESEFSLSRKPEETIYTLTSHDNVIYMNSFFKEYFAISSCGLYGIAEETGGSV